jgi:hypothetical protein
VEELQGASQLRETAPPARVHNSKGTVELKVAVSGNGLNFVVLRKPRVL